LEKHHLRLSYEKMTDLRRLGVSAVQQESWASRIVLQMELQMK